MYIFIHIFIYTKSESDIQNNDLFYKNTKKCQNSFDLFEFSENRKTKKINVLFYNMHKFHNSYFQISNFPKFQILYSQFFTMLYVKKSALVNFMAS